MRQLPPQRGFALIEMLVVVTIIAIIAAVAYPNLMNALDRGRRSSTVADLRTTANALERYAFDHHRYPIVDGIAALRGALAPRYLKELPVKDGWDHPFVYEVDAAGSTYTLLSPGKDGVQQTAATAATDEFAQDIVIVDGVFRSLQEALSTDTEQ